MIPAQEVTGDQTTQSPPHKASPASGAIAGLVIAPTLARRVAKKGTKKRDTPRPIAPEGIKARVYDDFAKFCTLDQNPAVNSLFQGRVKPAAAFSPAPQDCPDLCRSAPAIAHYR